MRLLHTSDWHLGQSLHQYDRSHEHERFLGWLLDVMESEEVDALLIAGDIFDNSNPSAAAQTMLYSFLTEARRRIPHLNIVLTAGNHDSPGRLEAPAPFLSLFDAHVVGQVSSSEEGELLDRLIVPLKDREGQVRAWCIAMPFLRPGDVPRIEGAADPYAAGFAAIYEQAIERANEDRDESQALIAIGHCHLTGGKVSEESERRIFIGGAEALSADVFDDSVAYVALGHLHLPQQIGKDPTRRYSGSPLPMSFSEIDYPHQVVLVDLDGAKVGSVRALRVPRSVDLLRVPDRPQPLDDVLVALAGLELPGGEPHHWPYLQVRVQLSEPEPALRSRVEAALQDKPVRLARIETSYTGGENLEASPARSIDDLNALAPVEFFTRLYLHRFGADAPPELLTAFGELLNTPVEEGIEP